MTVATPVDTKGAKPLALEDELSNLRQMIEGHIAKAMELATAASTKADDVEKDVKKFGVDFGEGSKVKEISEQWADHTAQVQEMKGSLDALYKMMASRPSNEKEKADETRRAAIRHFEQKHFETTSDWEERLLWTEAAISEDDFKAYEIADKAMSKIFRMKAEHTRPEDFLSREENIALSRVMAAGNKGGHNFASKSLNTGVANSLWIRPELSDRVIDCIEQPTDIGSLFSSMTISTSKVVFPKREDATENAKWRCELDCDPNNASYRLPGTLAIEVEELYAQVCATHEVLEDTIIDIEAWLAREAGEDFSRVRNRTFLQGNTDLAGGKIQGLMECVNTFASGRGLPAGPTNGVITQDDIVMLPVMMNPRFFPGAEWWASRTAGAALLTMKDANGRRIFDENPMPNGMNSINGKAMRFVTYMPEYFDATNGSRIIGGRPLMFINPREAYMVVNRLGLTVQRDPYTQAVCGVVWRWRMRMGGGCLCPDAAIALEIQA